MRIYLVRHGRTAWNREKRLQGSIDQPLDEEGESQAHQLGIRLKEVDFEKIYSSPLSRAHRTACILNQYMQKEVSVEPALREGSYGSAEGLTQSEYHQIFASQLAEAKSLPLNQRARHRTIPGSETMAEVANRALPFLMNLAQTQKGKNLLIVSHGGVIRSLLVTLFEMDDTGFSIENTGYVVLEFKDACFTMKETSGFVKHK
jgi:broad specificity phosphatase PhoE